MFIYKVGICDDDFCYAVRLMEFFNSNKDIPLMAVSFSGEEAVAEYLENNDLDILLTSKDIDTANAAYVKVMLRECAGGEHDILKYQSATEIARQLVNSLGRKISGGKSSRFIAIYSPVGRCGKTTLGIELCRESPEYIYINLEDFSSIQADSSNQKVDELFMYYLATCNEKIVDLFEAITKREQDARVIVGANGLYDRSFDLKSLSWLDELLSRTGSDYKFVLDIGVAIRLNGEGSDVINQIIVPYIEDEASKHKVANFRKYLETLGKKATSRFKFVAMDMNSKDATGKVAKAILSL